MKITDQTTLAELQAYLETLGNPFLTVMKTQPGNRHARQAIAYMPNVGTFNGGGNTEAEAIEDALAGLRAALGITNLAYEPLNYIHERLLKDDKPSRIGVSLREQTERVMATLTPREREVLAERMETSRRAKQDPAYNKFRQTADEVPEPPKRINADLASIGPLMSHEEATELREHLREQRGEELCPNCKQPVADPYAHVNNYGPSFTCAKAKP